MANKTIGQLDSAATAESADLIEIEQSGVSKYASIDQILNNTGREISASGFKFAASGNPGATSSTLGDYEEGTWTPAYGAASGSFGAITYLAEGKYTKIGNMVHIHFFLRTDALAVGTASGNLFVSGLPFMIGTTYNAGIAIPYSSSFVGEEPNGGLFGAAVNYFVLYYKSTADGNSSPSQAADLQTGASAAANYIIGFASYRAE